MYQCCAYKLCREPKYFICSTYCKGRISMTHSIKNVVLHEIVLRNLREALMFHMKRSSFRTPETICDRDGEFVWKRETLAGRHADCRELDRIIPTVWRTM